MRTRINLRTKLRRWKTMQDVHSMPLHRALLQPWQAQCRLRICGCELLDRDRPPQRVSRQVAVPLRPSPRTRALPLPLR
eukprot:724524-Pyramimonas_sp.AAC.1